MRTKKTIKPNLDTATIDYIISLCKQEEEWCLNTHRNMEFGAWGRLKEKLIELKGGQE